MADNALCCASVLGVLVLRTSRRTDRPTDNPPAYRTTLFNPIAFCIASGFVVIRSALMHQLQGLLLLFFVGGGIATIKLFRDR